MFNLKESRTALEIASFDKNNLFMHARIGRLTVHDHMTPVVKIYILPGHEGIGNLHSDLKIIFHCIFIEKKYTFSQNMYIVNYESITYGLTKFYLNIYF